MNRPIPRTEIEQFTAKLAEKRRRMAKAEQSVRGYRDEDGVWRGGLLAFVKYFWHVLEPGTEFVSGWVLEAITEHLEAVTFGEITNLLINVFPGAMKSLLTDVFWPAWEHGPMNMPHIRYVAFSYSSSLTERDNIKFRDLIVSTEYRAMYPHVQLRQEGARKVSNTKHGWKLASSVGGVGTGERGDRIICLPYSETVLTSSGWLPIGQIVQSRLDVSIAGLDHGKGLAWQNIEAFEENPGGELVEIKYEGGSLKCTVDHPVYVQGRGYVRADSIQAQEEVLWAISPDAMQALWDDYSPQAEPNQGLLQPNLSERGRARGGLGEQQQALCSLRQDGLRPTSASCATEGAMLLRPQVSRPTQPRAEQPSLPNWAFQIPVQAMRGRLLSKEQRSCTQKRGLLLSQMFDAISVGYGTVKEVITESLRVLCKPFPAMDYRKQILFEGVCECRSFRSDAWFWQWPVRSWRMSETLSEGMEQQLQGSDTRTRWQSLPGMFARSPRKWRGPACPSHRLREVEYPSDEPDYGLQILSRVDARRQSLPRGMDRKTVVSVKRIGRAEKTFNIRVHPCSNYFASGILVHNCDDGHNIKESESETVRKETVRWFRESMSSRLNNMETGAKIVIMQRVNEDDIAGNILTLQLPYCHLCIPLEYVWSADENGEPYRTDIGWADPRWQPDPDDCEGELAWPERFPEDVVSRIKKEVGPYGFASQYQQTPEARGGGLIKREWWMPAEAVMSADGTKYPPFSYIVASLDGAYTEKEQNDPSALTVWGIFLNEHGYNRAMLVHAWSKRLQFSGPRMDLLPGEHESIYRRRAMPHWGLIEWVADTCKRFKADKLLIEAKATGISVAQSLRNSHGREGWSIELIDPKGDKMARGMAIVPSFSQEMVYAPERGWADEVIKQCATFPYGSEDDLYDTVTQALKHLRDSGLIRSDEDRRAEELEAVKHKGAPKRPHYPGFRQRRA